MADIRLLKKFEDFELKEKNFLSNDSKNNKVIMDKREFEDIYRNALSIVKRLKAILDETNTT